MIRVDPRGSEIITEVGVEGVGDVTGGCAAQAVGVEVV